MDPAQSLTLTAVKNPPENDPLGALERLASTAMLSDGVSTVLERARETAKSVAETPSPHTALRGVLGRRLAVAETHVAELEVLLARAVARADFPAARALSTILDSTTRRLVSLASALSDQARPRSLPSIVVGAANNVAIGVVR